MYNFVKVVKGIVSVLIWGVAPLTAQITSVEPVDKAIVKSTDRIALYAVPKTMLAVRCYFSQKQQLVGPYAHYARELIGREGFRYETTYTEIDSITITPFTAIDASLIYVVKFGKKTDDDMLVHLAQRGFIIYPIGQLSTLPMPDSVWLGQEGQAEWVTPIVPFISSISDTTYRIVVKDSLLIKEPIVKSKKTTPTPIEQAREVAKLIQQIHQRRLDLVLADEEPLPASEKTLQWIAAQLQHKEEEYLQLFLGKTITRKFAYTFYFDPITSTKEQQAELFRFSSQRGITSKSDATASPVIIKIEAEKSLSTLHDYQPLFSTLNGPYLFYRVPEIASISVSWRGKVFVRLRQPVLQLGTLVPLLPSGR